MNTNMIALRQPRDRISKSIDTFKTSFTGRQRPLLYSTTATTPRCVLYYTLQEFVLLYYVLVWLHMMTINTLWESKYQIVHTFKPAVMFLVLIFMKEHRLRIVHIKLNLD